MSHRHSRRAFVAGLTATAGLVAAGNTPSASAAAPKISKEEMAKHEKFMRLAIEQAKRNPGRPFGSVIVDNRTGTVVGEGVVNMGTNPMYHSEVVAMNDYVAKHGNQGWEHLTMYGTGEACPMCMSAMIWAGLPNVVYGSEMSFVRKYVNLIFVRAKDVVAAAHPLYTSKLMLGGVLSAETDQMFVDRAKALAAQPKKT